MARLSRERTAQIALGVLIVIVIRALAEFFRLHDPATVPLGAELLLYLYGALAAAATALVVLILYAFGWHRTGIALTGIAILSLLVAKIVVVY